MSTFKEKSLLSLFTIDVLIELKKQFDYAVKYNMENKQQEEEGLPLDDLAEVLVRVLKLNPSRIQKFLSKHQNDFSKILSWDIFLEIIDHENNLNNTLLELKTNGFSTKRYKEGERKLLRLQHNHPEYRNLQIERILSWDSLDPDVEYYLVLFDNDKLAFFDSIDFQCVKEIDFDYDFNYTKFLKQNFPLPEETSDDLKKKNILQCRKPKTVDSSFHVKKSEKADLTAEFEETGAINQPQENSAFLEKNTRILDSYLNSHGGRKSQFTRKNKSFDISWQIEKIIESSPSNLKSILAKKNNKARHISILKQHEASPFADLISNAKKKQSFIISPVLVTSGPRKRFPTSNETSKFSILVHSSNKNNQLEDETWGRPISENERKNIEFLWRVFKNTETNNKVESEFVGYANRLLRTGRLHEVERLNKFLASKKWGEDPSGEIEAFLKKNFKKQGENEEEEQLDESFASVLEDLDARESPREKPGSAYLHDLIKINNNEYHRKELQEKFKPAIEKRNWMRKTVLENQKTMNYIDNYTSKQKGKTKLHIIDFFVYEKENLLVISLISREIRIFRLQSLNNEISVVHLKNIKTVHLVRKLAIGTHFIKNCLCLFAALESNELVIYNIRDMKMKQNSLHRRTASHTQKNARESKAQAFERLGDVFNRRNSQFPETTKETMSSSEKDKSSSQGETEVAEIQQQWKRSLKKLNQTELIIYQGRLLIDQIKNFRFFSGVGVILSNYSDEVEHLTESHDEPFYTSKQTFRLKPRDGEHFSVSSLNFSQNEQVLAFGSINGKIIIYDPFAKQTCHELDSHKEEIIDIHFNPKQNLMITVSSDKNIVIWETLKFSVVQELQENDFHTPYNKITTSLYSSKKDYLLTAGSHLKIWKSKIDKSLAAEKYKLDVILKWRKEKKKKNPKETMSILEYRNLFEYPTKMIVFSLDGRYFLVLDIKNCIKIFESAFFKSLHSFVVTDGNKPINAVCFTHSFRVLNIGYESGEIHIRSIYSEEVYRKIYAVPTAFSQLIQLPAEFDFNCIGLGTGLEDPKIIFFKSKLKSRIESHKVVYGHLKRIVAWVQSGTLLFSCDSDNIINVWDVRNGSLQRNMMIKDLMSPLWTATDQRQKDKCTVFHLSYGTKEPSNLFAVLEKGDFFELDVSKSSIVRKFSSNLGLKPLFCFDTSQQTLVSCDANLLIRFYKFEERNGTEKHELMRLRTNLNFSFVEPEQSLRISSNLKVPETGTSRKITIAKKPTFDMKNIPSLSPTIKKPATRNEPEWVVFKEDKLFQDTDYPSDLTVLKVEYLRERNLFLVAMNLGEITVWNAKGETYGRISLSGEFILCNSELLLDEKIYKE